MNRPIARSTLKWVWIAVGSLTMLLALWVEVAILARMADDYKASIVRDTVAAIKESNNAK